MKRLLQILTGMAFLLWPLAEALSLPPCPDSSQIWHNCSGSHTLKNGEKYVGEWQNDMPNGQGTSYSLNGDKCVGEFKDGNLHGQGTCYYSNGDKDEGEWRNGKRLDFIDRVFNFLIWAWTWAWRVFLVVVVVSVFLSWLGLIPSGDEKEP